MKVVRDGKCPSCEQSRTTFFGHPENSEGGFAFTKCMVWEKFDVMLRTHALIGVGAPARDTFCQAALRAGVVIKAHTSIMGGTVTPDYWVPHWVADLERWLVHSSPDHMETVLVLAKNNAEWREEVLGAGRLGVSVVDLWKMCRDKIAEELASRLDEQRLALVRPYIEGLTKNTQEE